MFLDVSLLTAMLIEAVDEADSLLTKFGRGPFPSMMIVADWLEENGDGRAEEVRRRAHQSRSTQLEFLGRTSDAPGLPAQCLKDIARLFPDLCLCVPPAVPVTLNISQKDMLIRSREDAREFVGRRLHEAGMGCVIEMPGGIRTVVTFGPVRQHFDLLNRQHVYTKEAEHVATWCPQNAYLGLRRITQLDV